MKLNVDFSALHRAVAPLGYFVSEFFIKSDSVELESIGSHLIQGMILGKDVQLGEIDGTNGVLNFNGHQVMLYIPDQGRNISSVLIDGKQKGAKRVHVAECSTIIGMRERGRFDDRYDVISRTDGLFPVFGSANYSSNEIKGDADLAVCQNCLTLLNHDNFSELYWGGKAQLVKSFSYAKFFETYSSYFKALPKNSNNNSSNYTADWPSISAKLRSELDYTCEQCGVDLKTEKKLLHTHHINGNKANNDRLNLRVLCADCHKKQPHHDHLNVSYEDVQKINQLRREQHKFDVFNYEKLLACADTALDGLILKCQSTQLPSPELGIVVADQDNFAAIDLCWPRRKVAVLINIKNANLLRKHGWTVFTVFEALSNFESFQFKIR